MRVVCFLEFVPIKVVILGGRVNSMEKIQGFYISDNSFETLIVT